MGERAKSAGDLFDRGAVVAASANTGRLLRAAREARVRDGLTAEDLLIFLAVGHLGIDATGEIPRTTPCTHLQIAQFLGVPRETVRRKVGRLCDRGYTRGGPTGIVVRDLDAWMRQVAALFATPAPAGDGQGRAMRGEVDVAELRQREK